MDLFQPTCKTSLPKQNDRCIPIDYFQPTGKTSNQNKIEDYTYQWIIPNPLVQHQQIKSI